MTEGYVDIRGIEDTTEIEGWGGLSIEGWGGN